MELIDKVIGALSDGSWHTLNELTTREELRDVSMTKLRLILDFLAEYDFIELNHERPVVEAKLKPKVYAFIEEIKKVERFGGK